MEIDPTATATVDKVLTTTRAVRRRLDLERDVDDEIILDCIDIAEQAPTGGNQGSRRWLVVRDPELKQRLADLYRDVIGNRMIEARDRLAGTGDPRERSMLSAAHLAEHLGEVPVIVIPVILGCHDGSGRPGLFDSVIQSGWSFCLALRARGLGTAWTTAGLAKAPEVKELLGIPDDVTEIAMFPVAWTVGSDFKPARRLPAREIAYFDGYARTYERGPSVPVRIADGPGTVVEVDIRAEPAAVWAEVTDINLPARFSEEFQWAEWTDGHDGPAPGACFVGRNHHPARGDWEVSCFVDVFEEQVAFGWCTSDIDNPGARWRFELEPVVGGTRLRFRGILGPGPSGLDEIISARPDLEPRIIDRRMAEHRANMQRVVEGVRAAAEQA
jgi:nitroreductase